MRETYGAKDENFRDAAETARLFNEKFGTNLTKSKIWNIAQNHGIKCGIPGGQIQKGQRISPGTEFKKGNIPWSKGRKGLSYPEMVKTQFQKGHQPHNYRPIGSEVTSADGCVWVKIADPNIRREKHRIVWEAHNGPIPKGYVILFADKNKSNCELENLILVSRAEMAVLNRFKLITDNAELTRLGVTIAKLRIALSARKKGKV